MLTLSPYWIAPIIGSLIAVCAFKLIKSTEAVRTTRNESSDRQASDGIQKDNEPQQK